MRVSQFRSCDSISLFSFFVSFIFFFGDSSEGREKKKKQNSSDKTVEFRKQGRRNEYKTKEIDVVRKRFGGFDFLRVVRKIDCITMEKKN